MRLNGRDHADGCGAAILNKPALIPERKARILAGDQFGVSAQFRMVLHNRQPFARHVAQLALLPGPFGKVTRPALPHVSAHPQPVFAVSDLHAEAQEAALVRALSFRFPLGFPVFHIQARKAQQICIERPFFKICAQCAQTIRRVFAGTPRSQLRQIFFKFRIFILSIREQVFQAVRQRKGRALRSRASFRFRRAGNHAILMFRVQFLSLYKAPVRRQGHIKPNLLHHESNREQRRLRRAFDSAVVYLAKFLNPAHRVPPPFGRQNCFALAGRIKRYSAGSHFCGSGKQISPLFMTARHRRTPSSSRPVSSG